MLSLIYFGTADFAAAPLKKLLARPEDVRVLAVVSQPDKPAGRKGELAASPVATLAREAGIPLLQPATLKDDAAITLLAGQGADLFVVAAYGKIIPQAILDIPKLGCLNLHGSILPKYRGASPIQAAILAGEKQTGVSLMQMDAKMDHGPVYAVATAAISSDDTHASLEKKLSDVAADLLLANLGKIADGTLAPAAQNHDEATLTSLIDKEDGHIRWAEESAQRIEQKLRAYTPWPGIFTVWKRHGKDLRLKLHAVEALDEEASPQSLAPGTAFLHDGMLAVKAARGSLLVQQLQPEGKPPMPSEAFLQGYRDVIAAALE